LNAGKSVQMFLSLSRNDIIKYKLPFNILEFSVDLFAQPYVLARTNTDGQDGGPKLSPYGTGVQAGVTGNLGFGPLIERILGKDTTWDAALFGTVAGQAQYDFGGSNDGFSASIPWMVGFKLSKKIDLP